MTPVAASIDEILGFLVDRSVVFRRIAPNEAQFVHRSLQEYLAACDYADNGMVDELVLRSSHEDWQQIIAFAAGKMAIPMASALVSRLLDRSQESGVDNRSLLILAAQCYGLAGSLEDAVAARTKTMLTEVLPPKTVEEAEVVRFAGNEILPWLEWQVDRSTEITICCIRAAALIAGAGGMTALAAYSEVEDIEPEVVLELLRDWQQFDAREYAEDVLANLPLDKFVVALESVPMVQAAPVIEGLRSVRVTVREGLASFRDWAHLARLEEIDWPRNSSISSLDGIGDIGRLRKLNLSDSTRLQDIGDIARARSLQQLYLNGCTNIDDLEALRGLASLEVLFLDRCLGVRDFTPISGLSQLKTLSVNACRITDLDFCETLEGLQALWAEVRDGILDISALAKCGSLHRLAVTLRLGALDDLDFLSKSQIWDLSLSGVVSLKMTRTVGRCRQLERLSIRGAEWMRDLSFLVNLRRLRRLSVTGCSQLGDASAIAGLTDLERLDLSGSDIADTQFLSKMTGLKQLKLEGCRNLADLSGLFGLPRLEYVSIVGGAVRANAHELRQRSASRQRLVVVEQEFYAGGLAARILEQSRTAPGPGA